MNSFVKGILFLSTLVFIGCNTDENLSNAALDGELTEVIEAAGIGGIGTLVLPESDDFDRIPQDPRNPLTSEKVMLGKLLFHETALGIDGVGGSATMGTFSCASCHHAEGGFQANRWQGIGEGGVGFGRNGEGRTRAANFDPNKLDVQPLRTPSVLNSGYQKITLWNGQFGATDLNIGTEAQWTDGTPKETNNLGFEGIETQAIAGLKVHRLKVNEELLNMGNYRDLFDAAFSNVPARERYSLINAGLAIAAYERTVLANRAPFQAWLAGETSAMSDAEKRGAIVFFGDGNCASCHAGPSLATMSFHALGMDDLHDCPEPVFQSSDNLGAHLGRGGFTMRSEDMYAFKTPQLYNLVQSPFYGHGASFRSIKEVVEYKNKALPQNSRVDAGRLSAQFVPLNLTEDQIDDLVTFLEDGLFDPELNRYKPENLPSGNCFPNADPLSRADLNCN